MSRCLETASAQIHVKTLKYMIAPEREKVNIAARSRGKEFSFCLLAKSIKDRFKRG